MGKKRKSKKRKGRIKEKEEFEKETGKVMKKGTKEMEKEIEK